MTRNSAAEAPEEFWLRRTLFPREEKNERFRHTGFAD